MIFRANFSLDMNEKKANNDDISNISKIFGANLCLDVNEKKANK